MEFCELHFKKLCRNDGKPLRSSKPEPEAGRECENADYERFENKYAGNAALGAAQQQINAELLFSAADEKVVGVEDQES